MYIHSWVLVLIGMTLLGGWLALAYLWRAYRCMRLCYLEMSDFAVGRTGEIEEELRSVSADQASIPDSVTKSRRDWRKLLAHHQAMMARASIPAVAEQDFNYVFSDA